MAFCTGLHMTCRELELLKPVEDIALRHITFVNDITSYDKEAAAAREGFELGGIFSSVPIMADLLGVGVNEAKRVMWQMMRAWETRSFELVDELVSTPDARPELRMSLKGLEYEMAGNERWSLLTPRCSVPGAPGGDERRC